MAILSVPLKKTTEIDIEKPIKKIISNIYGKEDNDEKVSKDVKNLQNLR